MVVARKRAVGWEMVIIVGSILVSNNTSWDF